MNRARRTALLILFGLVIAVIDSAISQAKINTLRGGCCGGDSMSMTEMKEHSQHQLDAKSTANSKDKTSSPSYTCPMHPDVKSDRPGKCPKCGMNLAKAKESTSTTSGNDSTMNQKSDAISNAKMKLVKQGKYKCCIEDPCDTCVKHGGCKCKEAVKNNKSVCGECYQGWKQGQGNVPGKTLKDIKWGHGH